MADQAPKGSPLLRRDEDVLSADFREIVRQHVFAPDHPGHVLREEFLPRLGLRKADLAAAVGISRQMLHRILSEQSGISPSVAVKLAGVTRTSPQFWMRLQELYDLWVLTKAEQFLARDKVGTLLLRMPLDDKEVDIQLGEVIDLNNVDVALAAAQNVLSALVGRARSSPVLSTIADTGAITVAVGTYLRPASETATAASDASVVVAHQFRPSSLGVVPIGLPPLWNWEVEYLRQCGELAKEALLSRQLSVPSDDLRFVPGDITGVSMGYRWLVDKIAFEESDRAKVMIPLEVIFETPQRSKKIGVIQLGSVPSFKFGYNASRSLLRSGSTPSIDDLIKIVPIRRASDPSARVFTVADTSAAEMLISEVYALGDSEFWQEAILPMPSYETIADALTDNDMFVLDVGLADDLLAELEARRRKPMRRVIFEACSVSYRKPIPAGLAFRCDDSAWEDICREAWLRVKRLILSNKDLRNGFDVFKREAVKQGIIIDDVAA